ncbi:glycosyltransferase family 39 protein [Pseudonocardia sp. DSM 110487]|uniref:ArnT family glycosyltransferase n=1 Tax=Pseudonocardia sp. DSM 110487 TaxID=2865833 RepID=UPI001C6A3D96|nr:glycosyltransferase family 39 protein [Pseudonocardia sp. DSM 110487]QYN34328.1 glycosyltransferase family 39 protein [Pseudonocardia sp. DSM 110487]
MTATLAPAHQAPAAVAERPRRRTEWIALAILLVATAVLYLWNLGAEGWANTYYAGAVRAMTQNWTAFFFGSTDAGNTVTVDKPPASLWVIALSARIFGLSSWSMLVPQALMGVGAVALLYAAVRRVASPAAALLAGGVFALTPIAVLMFRYNNPDALLVLLLVAAAYATVRAIERASTRWIVLAGALIGFAFLAKMMQAFVVIPALALAYLVAAPTGFWRRVRQLLAAGLAVVVAAGWWVVIAELWPASSRPYIGGSENNSVLDLTFGYNGLGRIFGQGGGGRQMEPPAGMELPAGAEAGGGGFGGFGGAAGWSRLFNEQAGGQISWLLPAALALLVAGLALTWRAARTDRLRASLLLWGGWTVVTAAVFSFAQGIFHPYYTVALAPGIAALAGIGGMQLWRRRAAWPARITLSVITAGTAAWAVVLLSRTPDFVPWLRWVVIAVAAVAVLALLIGAHWRRLAVVAALAVLLTGGAAQLAYAADTITSTHNGGNPTAGPATADSGPGGGMRFGPGPDGGRRDDGGANQGGAGGGFGSRANASDPEFVALLRNAGTKWAAATTSASSSAGLALASGADVMGIGGFNGADPAPTLEQFRSLVAAGEVHYFIGGGGGPGGNSEIATWVRDTFTSTTVGGTTVYDLTQPVG